MKTKQVCLVASLLLLFACGTANAAVTEIVGGIRDGAALGIQLESSVAKNLTLRGGLEFNSGKQPFVAFIGGKVPLTGLGRMPLGLGLGLVGYFGNSKTDLGLSLSFIFGNFLDIKPLFLELGIDAAGSGRLLAQLGYKIY
ncbi:MAG: hypothetical protein WC529_07865 [Candidatus Margulisiibacteriota bacterium]